MSELVSVVVPFLNGARFLGETIDSVLAQSYDDWELLLVDDGSTDESTRIALQYVERYPSRIRYLEHDGHRNLGACASRNLGVRHAKGAFIAPLDADDVWLPDKLREQVAILDAHPTAGMAFGPSLYWWSWTGRPEDVGRDSIPNHGVPPNTLVAPPSLLMMSLRRQAATPCPSNLLIRTEVVERVGGFEEQFHHAYQLFEDHAFLAKVFLAVPVFVSGRCWDRYRHHPESCIAVARRTGTKTAVALFYLRWLEDYLKRRGDVDPELWDALRSRRRQYRFDGAYWVRHRLRYLAWRAGDIARTVARRASRRSPFDTREPAPGWVRFGDLRRVRPVSAAFGTKRGRPVDRHYIDAFLRAHRADIRGRVLEIGGDRYTWAFGGNGVTRSDVLHVAEGNPKATIVADLTRGESLPSDAFDCIILTQTLQFIYDVPAAIRTLHRILKPGGVLLVTAGGISQISRWDMERWGHYWNFTSLSLRRLLEARFAPEAVEVEAHGNALVATALLHGIVTEELTAAELAHDEPDYEVTITARAVKAGTPA